MELASSRSPPASCQVAARPRSRTNGLQIQRIIAGVTDGSGTVHASLVQGDAPNPNGGPTNTAAGFAAMVTGGSSQQTITGSGAFTRIVVAMPGARNYYELTVPSGTTTPIILRAAENLSSMNMGVSYAVGDANVIGKYTAATVKIINVGNGDVQVSVSWSDTSDVDLHVVDPALEEIYFGHLTSASGGKLDLDSNAACTQDEPQLPAQEQREHRVAGWSRSSRYFHRAAGLLERLQRCRSGPTTS